MGQARPGVRAQPLSLHSRGAPGHPHTHIFLTQLEQLVSGRDRGDQRAVPGVPGRSWEVTQRDPRAHQPLLTPQRLTP